MYVARRRGHSWPAAWEPPRRLATVKPFLRSALDGDIGPPRLGLGLVAHRVDAGDPRDGGCDTGLRGDEYTGAAGNPRPHGVEPDRDLDLCSRRDWTAVGPAARNRVRDLGSGVFVARRSRLAHGRLVL